MKLDSFLDVFRVSAVDNGVTEKIIRLININNSNLAETPQIVYFLKKTVLAGFSGFPICTLTKEYGNYQTNVEIPWFSPNSYTSRNLIPPNPLRSTNIISIK